MVDSVIDSVDLNILGGPSEVSLEVDFGPEGQRGSQIYITTGNPNESGSGLPADIKYNDLAINTSTVDPQEYLNVYQYISSGGVDVWEKVFRITTNFYSYKISKTFVNGSTTINVPVNNIIASSLIGNVSATNFNVQCTLSGSNNPIASGLSIGELLEVDDLFVLPITVNSAEFADGLWSLLSGSMTVHLFITVV